MYDFLIVGAGLFGAVFAHEAMKKGKKCLVIDKRKHIAGNIYTEKIEEINVHKYGAHIFHTSDKVVWDYINRFAEFNNYINSPIAVYNDELYNLPFNMNTFSKMWDIKTPAEAKAKIAEQIENLHIDEPKNLEEQALKLVGSDVYEKLIKGYTEKQWGRECKNLPAFIIKRLPLRFTYNNNYFNDRFQGIPIGGYTQIIEKMLDGIGVWRGMRIMENNIINPATFLDWIMSALKTMVDWVGMCIANAGVSGITITNPSIGGSFKLGVDYVAFAEEFSPIFQLVAYSLCVIFFGIGLIESGSQGDLFTIKGGIKAAVGLLLSKIWVDISITVCKFIVSISCDIVLKIFAKSINGFTNFPAVNIGEYMPTNDIPIIGPLLNFIAGIVMLLPLLSVLIYVIVLLFKVIIKLMLNSFEIALLMSVSPVFFACLVSDATKQYFRRFITTFIGVAFQLLFMILTYAVTSFYFADTFYLNGTAGDLMSTMFSCSTYFIVLIAMGKMMVTPPKILSDLVS